MELDGATPRLTRGRRVGMLLSFGATPMGATITLIGNEGFHVAAGGAGVFIDAFCDAVPALPPGLAERRAELILVTHSHWDHFGADAVAAAAERTGASVLGPPGVCRALRKRLPAERMVAMDPAPAPRGQLAAAATAVVRSAKVSAFRTRHSHDHNSYLVEMGGLRFFHDGDNEETRCLDPAALRPLDALFIGPWQGSGWAQFVEAVAPRRWFLMHLSDEELAEHEAGVFLTETCGCRRVPADLVVLHPGESMELP